ncbi:MAG: radical SAM protein [Chloroflexi bacterium]|nr:MAG: radical SAM protein [Chloroflexota bacterium]
MEIRRISIISPQPGILVGGSYHDIMPVFGPLLVGTILARHGYEVKIFEERLWPMDWDYILSSDAIGLYVMTCTVRRSMDHSRRIKAHNPAIPIVAGGTHVSELPEDTLRFVDYVVRKEADETLPDLLNALQQGRDPAGVPGISFKRDGQIIHTPDRPPVRDIDVIPDMSLIHRFKSDPRWKLWFQGRKVLNVIQASRGCPFSCSFCYGTRMLGVGYRMRSVESLVDEIKARIAYSESKKFLFVDNHFVGNPRFTRQLLVRLKAEGIRFLWCLAFTRIEVANHEDILDLMVDVGITNLHIGLESFHDTSLSGYNKRQSRQQVIDALQTIRQKGLRISGSFVLGTDNDTLETTRETVDLALEYGVHNYIGFSIMEFPGVTSPGLVPTNRMIIRDYDYGNGTFVMHFPKNMRPSVLQREMNRGLRRFYVAKVGEDLRQRNLYEIYYKATHLPLYLSISKYWNEYVSWLEEIEQGLYDENDHLIEARLPEDGIFPPDMVRAWRPEVQANVVHLGGRLMPSRPDRVPAGYRESEALVARPLAETAV